MRQHYKILDEIFLNFVENRKETTKTNKYGTIKCK